MADLTRQLVASPDKSHTETCGTDGDVTINIKQNGQNLATNTSSVKVWGTIKNRNSATQTLHGIQGRITGTNSATDQFDLVLKHEDEKTFIDWSFDVVHSSDGTKTVDYTVHFDSTGNPVLGNSGSSEASLDLTPIAQPTDVPGNPTFSDNLPGTITVSWTKPSDDGGAVIQYYRLRRYTGRSLVPPYKDYIVKKGLTTTITDIVPGTLYTFLVQAYNASAINDGFSDPSGSEAIQTVGGGYVRYGGRWKAAIPYVRHGGKWKLAVPYIRKSGVWDLTE